MKLVQKTISCDDATQFDFECNEIRSKFDVKFSTPSTAIASMGDSYKIIYTCVILYEVK